jgi:tripartite-type tricarboxylate transporter receptor subunit TctC
MSRLLVLIIVVVLIIAALFFLSTLPKQQPTHTIEVAVPQPAGGNAH